jgi:cytoskeletal protein CcmA (bactofilin family)
MFNKKRQIESDRGAAAAEQSPSSGRAQPAATPEAMGAVSSISSGMTVVGKIVGEGAVKIFGRVEGDLQASTVLICEGAQVEGNVVAQELTISGCFKGTIHAVRVKLLGGAEVNGDIFNRSLSIEENARFEGSSRREDNAQETPLIQSERLELAPTGPASS